MLKTCTLQAAVFQLIASYYTFNLEYTAKGKEAFSFLDKKMLEIDDKWQR